MRAPPFALAIVVAAVLGASGGVRPAAADAESAAAYVVIVHASNPAERLERRFVSDAFLKKRVRWSDDKVIRPVDRGPRAAIRARFSRVVLGRSVEAVRRYWSQRVFSGSGVPPPELDSDDAILRYVASTPGAIGYVSSDAALAEVKIVTLY